METAISNNELLNKYFPDKSFEDLLKLGGHSEPVNVRDTINCIEKMMKANAQNITYTQLRNILQVVKKEEYEQNLSQFYMVIPKLAYMEARPQKNNEGKKIIAFIREMAGEVKTTDQYKGFEEVMNTIVAYHKLHG